MILPFTVLRRIDAVLEKINPAVLHRDRVSNIEIVYIFEELVRRFNEALNENPGEHFTPREVIRLMVNLLLAQDAEALSRNHIVRTIYDPCCGSGGMLTIAKERITEINPHAEVHLFGQEVNTETFAMCKSDLYMKSADGRDAENISLGSVLSNDRHAGKRFDYLLANPPYGKDVAPNDLEPLSEIIQELNQRFGTEFTEEDKVFIRQLEEKLAVDAALENSVKVNTRENARLTSDIVVNDRLQEMIDSNFKF